jgi:hypothetical protein
MSPAKPTSRYEICQLGVKSVGFDMSAACPVSGLISEVAAKSERSPDERTQAVPQVD